MDSHLAGRSWSGPMAESTPGLQQVAATVVLTQTQGAPAHEGCDENSRALAEAADGSSSPSPTTTGKPNDSTRDLR